MIIREERIGGQRLILGDCLQVMPLLGKVDAVVTDPPYGNANHDGDWNARLNDHRGLENKPIANDTPEAMRSVLDAALRIAASLLPKGRSACCCFCGGGGPRPVFAWLAERMDRDGLAFFHSVVWDKLNPGLGQRYRRQHEMMMVAHKTGGSILWGTGQPQAPNIMRLSPPRVRLHPNEKPLALIEEIVGRHSDPGQTILDPFMGSGTTLVACHRMGRSGIGIELDPDYFAIACKRVDEAARQPDLLIAPPKPAAVQEGFDL